MMNPYDNRDSEELTAATQAGEQVKDLMEHPGWEVLVAEVGARRDQILAVVIHGNPFSQIEKYAYSTGQVSGIEEFTGIAEQIVSGGESAADQLEYMEAAA